MEKLKRTLSNSFKVVIILCFSVGSGTALSGQNFIETGNFVNNCGWDFYGRGGCTTAYFSASAGTSFIWTSQANTTGNAYFRLFTDWGGNQQRHEPATTTQLFPETPYILGSNWGLAFANYVNVPSTTYTYVFKTPSGDGINNTPRVIIFEVQGTPQSVSAVSQTPAAVTAGSNVTVEATVTGGATLPAGQGVYLRYSDDNFATSTVVEMTWTGSGAVYDAIIPAGFNIAGANISWYVFTSGDGMTIAPGNADWFTINLNNNGGGNYNYTVAAAIWTTSPTGSGVWSDPLSWDPGTVPPVGVQVGIEDNLILDQDAEISGMTIDPGITFTGSDGSFRKLIFQPGAFLNCNGTFLGAGGIVSFGGNGTVSGTVDFGNVETAGGLNFGATSTVADTFRINNGGFVNTNPPALLTGAYLQYATGNDSLSPFIRSTEWNNPHHVLITDSTWLDWPAGNNMSSLSMNGDLKVVSGGLLWRDAERELNVGGHVNIESGGTILMSTMVGGDLYLAGDLTNQGTFLGNNRTVRLNGTVQQRIFGDFQGTNRFHYLDFDNVAGISLQTSVETEDTVRFYNGLVYLNSHHFSFLDSSVINPTASFAPDASSMLITNGSGTVRKYFSGPGTPFIFPLGDDTGIPEYSPATITFTSGTFAPGAYLEASVTDTKHPLNYSVTNYLTRYWEIEESGITSFSYTPEFSFPTSDISGSPANIYAWKSDDGGLTWGAYGLLQTTPNALPFGPQSSFSIFTGGDATPFPVEWGNFTAVRQGEKSKLDWTTLNEVNSDWFQIERAEDGIDFSSIGMIPAAGNHSGPLDYQFFDPFPFPGMNFYRIREIGMDGNTTLSGIRTVYFDPAEISKYPQFIPFSKDGKIWVRIYSSEGGNVQARCFDLAGRKLAEKGINYSAGASDYPIGKIDLSMGNILLFQAESGGTIYSTKINLNE